MTRPILKKKSFLRLKPQLKRTIRKSVYFIQLLPLKESSSFGINKALVGKWHKCEQTFLNVKMKQHSYKMSYESDIFFRMS